MRMEPSSKVIGSANGAAASWYPPVHAAIRGRPSSLSLLSPRGKVDCPSELQLQSISGMFSILQIDLEWARGVRSRGN